MTTIAVLYAFLFSGNAFGLILCLLDGDRKGIALTGLGSLLTGTALLVV